MVGATGADVNHFKQKWCWCDHRQDGREGNRWSHKTLWIWFKPERDRAKDGNLQINPRQDACQSWSWVAASSPILAQGVAALLSLNL